MSNLVCLTLYARTRSPLIPIVAKAAVDWVGDGDDWTERCRDSFEWRSARPRASLRASFRALTPRGSRDGDEDEDLAALMMVRLDDTALDYTSVQPRSRQGQAGYYWLKAVYNSHSRSMAVAGYIVAAALFPWAWLSHAALAALPRANLSLTRCSSAPLRQLKYRSPGQLRAGCTCTHSWLQTHWSSPN